MAKLNIINKDSIIRRLRRYALLGLAATTIYGAIWATPRAINQYVLNSSMDKLKILIQQRASYDEIRMVDYEEALKRIRKIEEKKFLSPKSAEKKINILYDSIREREIYHINYLVENDKNHQEAVEELKKYKKQGIFSPEDVKKLEAKIEEISPESLVKRGDNANNANFKEDFYSGAEFSFESEGKIIPPDLERKIVDASFESIYLDYNAKDIDAVFGRLGKIADRVKGKDVTQLVNDADIDTLFINSNLFMEEYLKGRDGDIGKTATYLSQMNYVAKVLKVKNGERRIRNLALIVTNDSYRRIKGGGDFNENHVSYLDTVLSLDRTYGPGNDRDIIELYLIAEGKVKGNPNVAKKFLDAALFHSESLSENEKEGLHLRIADGYVKLVRSELENPQGNIDIKNLYFMLKVAGGLYLDAGKMDSDLTRNLKGLSEKSLKYKGKVADNHKISEPVYDPTDPLNFLRGPP